MSYFVFQKNLPNTENTLYRIAENELDLNNLNIGVDVYKIIEDSQDNFLQVKLNNKICLHYDNNDKIVFKNLSPYHKNKLLLNIYIEHIKGSIKFFLDSGEKHPNFNNWNNYYNFLSSLNTRPLIYPINKSFEQYLYDENIPFFNILQLP